MAKEGRKMPAASESMRRLVGIALAMKRGEAEMKKDEEIQVELKELGELGGWTKRRIATGILMIICAVPLVVLAILSIQRGVVGQVFARSLPALLISLLAFSLGFSGYLTLHREMKKRRARTETRRLSE